MNKRKFLPSPKNTRGPCIKFKRIFHAFTEFENQAQYMHIQFNVCLLILISIYPMMAMKMFFPPKYPYAYLGVCYLKHHF